ncbi:hypothetical protein [Micromonospora sp. NBC_00421]|uniref:hypothetical protein n=1 Tax=Micromonospora sp. NBC_00421 TaxID=2975976 RepID=UPI002E1BA356
MGRAMSVVADRLLAAVAPQVTATAVTCTFWKTRCVTGNSSSGCASTNHKWTQYVYKCSDGSERIEFGHCGC